MNSVPAAITGRPRGPDRPAGDRRRAIRSPRAAAVAGIIFSVVATVFLGSGLLFVVMCFVSGATAGGLLNGAAETPHGRLRPGAPRRPRHGDALSL